jgi:hypothetical protein
MGRPLTPGRAVAAACLLLLQFLSLLQNNMIQDMVVLYAAERKIITVLKLGVPVCGHPTLVHGEQAPVPTATAAAQLHTAPSSCNS